MKDIDNNGGCSPSSDDYNDIIEQQKRKLIDMEVKRAKRKAYKDELKRLRGQGRDELSRSLSPDSMVVDSYFKERGVFDE